MVGVHRPWEVTYDANGGTWTSSVTNPELVEYLGKASIADYSLAVSRKNYKLLGWFTSATGGTQWAATNTVQQDMTLYAHWEATSYEVTVNPNGGTYTGTSPITVSSGGSINLITVSNQTSRDGYVLTEWRWSANGETYPTTGVITGIFSNGTITA